MMMMMVCFNFNVWFFMITVACEPHHINMRHIFMHIFMLKTI